MEKKKKLLVAIIILVFLNLLAAILFLYIRNNVTRDRYATDTIYNNRVNDPEKTPDGGADLPAQTQKPASVTPTPTAKPTSSPYVSPKVEQEASDIRISNAGSDGTGKATPIIFKNMFPGDSIGQTYTLTVEYTNTERSKSVLCFYCKAREGSDVLLLEGLELTVQQNGQTVWQGMASEINGAENGLLQKLYQLDGGETGTFTHRWDVTIIAELPTSAGNEYQNLKSILDFYWAVGSENELSGDDTKDIPTVSPKTGDTLNTALWGIGAAVTLLAIVIVIRRLRKEDESCEE